MYTYSTTNYKALETSNIKRYEDDDDDKKRSRSIKEKENKISS